MLCKHDTISDRNISREENKAINDLKEDESTQVVHADKGRVTVVLNKEDYTKKCQDLLNDSKTYTKPKKDSSAKYKNELISVLKEMKKRGVISVELHKKLYPTCDQPPRFYGLPKLHKQNMPFRPIVSSIGSSTYECAKYLAKILSPLVRKNAHHVNNSKDFASEIKGWQVENDEELRSVDVTALFTSLPVDEALVSFETD